LKAGGRRKIFDFGGDGRWIWANGLPEPGITGWALKGTGRKEIRQLPWTAWPPKWPHVPGKNPADAKAASLPFHPGKVFRARLTERINN